MTPERIAELRAICEKATEGPWVRDPYDYPYSQVIAHGNEVVCYHARHNRQVDERVVPNHAFIAAARVALPELLDEVGRLRAALEEERRQLTRYNVGATHWEGCEKSHHACAAIKRIDAALNPTHGAERAG